MQDLVRSRFEGKSIVIAGFGREGRSTYRFLRKFFPEQELLIADRNTGIIHDVELQNDTRIKIVTGEHYLKEIGACDVIFKTPGIPSFALPADMDRQKITSQTDLFLQLFGRQAIGITGTKGKSTTSSLIYHIIDSAGQKAILAGNIGTPLLDTVAAITPETLVVMELSSHQLEYLSNSPHIAILLNIFQEHLDHYESYEDYQRAKFNIAKCQKAGDYFIYNRESELITKHLTSCINCNHTALPYSLAEFHGDGIHYRGKKVFLTINGKEQLIYDNSVGNNLRGDHNLLNIAAASAACILAGIPEPVVTNAVRTFNSLEHRIEFAGTYHDVEFYNDSIATIPEATIEALKTLRNVNTLILGGFDRGIDYTKIYDYLSHSQVQNIIFVGEAGLRMKNEAEQAGITGKSMFIASDYSDVVDIAFRHTRKHSICLLSPAAASYDMFRNFEERGRTFKKLVRGYRA